MIARKMAIRFFGASFEFPCSWVNILAATVVLVWHDEHWVASCNMRDSKERVELA